MTAVALFLVRAGSVARVVARYREIIQRVLVTLGMLVVMRAGHFVALPGVDLQQLPLAAAASEGQRMMQAMYGQVRDLPASLFDLGISPVINASIFLGFLLAIPVRVWPPLMAGWVAALQASRKEGKAGEAHFTGCLNGVGLVFAIFGALVRAYELEPFAVLPQWFVVKTALALVAGTAITQHCASVITSQGIGNGTTLVIVTGIISGYAETLRALCGILAAGGPALWKPAALALSGYLGLVAFSVYLCSSELRLPVVHYSTSVSQKGGTQGADSGSSGGMAETMAQARRMMDQRSQRNDNFPLMLNSSGMMPIIYASFFYFGVLPGVAMVLGWAPLIAAVQALHGSALSLLPYGLVVFALEFLPVGGINPKDAADYLGTMNVGIRGVVPGLPTEQHVAASMRRCKVWGGLALATLAVAAQLFDLLCTRALGSSLSTPSLLIIVGAVLQSAKQVEALLEGPKLQQRLDGERELIQSLSTL